MLPSTSPLSICWTKVSIVSAPLYSDNKNGTRGIPKCRSLSRRLVGKTVATTKIPSVAIIASFLKN